MPPQTSSFAQPDTMDKPAKGTTPAAPDPLSDAALSQQDHPHREAMQKRIDGFKTHWRGMSRDQKDTFMNGLSAAEQADLFTMLGGKAHHAVVRAQPQFGTDTAANLLMGRAGQDPWVRQTAANLLNRTLNAMPAIGGMAGGLVGGVAGEAIVPTGGGAGGAVVGAALGGGAGEGYRQRVLHTLGWDKNDEPMTPGQRAREMGKAGLEQGAMEAVGQLTGKMMRPTLDRALRKLYFAGGLEHGDPMEQGDLESIFPELHTLEQRVPVKNNEGLVRLLSQTKKEIGQEVDAAYGPLLNRQANTQPLVLAVDNLIQRYSVNADIHAKPIKMLKELRTLAIKPRTFSQLADWRIEINNELQGFYAEHAGSSQQALLMARPDLLAKKEIADAIRDVSYPEMDRAAGLAPGTTAVLQKKRGAAIRLEKQALQHREALLNQSKQVGGTSPFRRGNMSGTVTSSGRLVGGFHRATSILHAPNVLRSADKRAASAFGHTVPTKVGKVLSSKPGMEALVAPGRYAFTPDPGSIPDRNGEEPEDEQTPPATPATQSLPAIRAQAEAQKPAAPVKKYALTATGPDGHRIGSDDGVTWFDLQTGAPFQPKGQ